VGGICALANVLPKETLEINQLVLDKKIDQAKLLQKRLYSPNAMVKFLSYVFLSNGTKILNFFTSQVTRTMGVPALKHMMDKFGFHGGPPRSPLLPLSNEDKLLVEKEFKLSGFGV